MRPLVLWLAMIPAAATAEEPPSFEREVAPLLKVHCRGCHGDEPELAGGLDLRLRRGMLTGGESGPAIVPGEAAASLLVQRVEAGEMPPGGKKRLSAEQIRVLRRWIDAGAPLEGEEPQHLPPPGEPFLTPTDLDLWSLKPLSRPEVPSRREAAHPIDAFVEARLHALGLELSPEADRRTLIRRLSFDLLGLPPTPEEMERFLSDDSPEAWEKLVDRMLASPHYGERWARHWLDVVHFGETHGYDKDKPRENAWPYRDYVIRAFNSDKPYARFVQEQVAGDILFPDTVDGVEALGFLAAGPWDFIGHVEVPESKIDGKIARHLDRDDMVQTTITTFLSLTVGCAQCHDHKFDPIPQADYYSLQAVFAALDRADRSYDVDPEIGRQRTTLLAEERRLKAEQAALAALIQERGGPELAELDRQIANARQPLPRPPEYGYHSAIAAAPDVVKWVQVDLGAPVEFSAVRLRPCEDDFNGIGSGFGFPVRYRLEASDDPTFTTGVRTLVDRTTADVPNPKLEPQACEFPPLVSRYVRLTATRLALRRDDYIFAVSELEVLTPRGENIARGREVTALDSIEAPSRWRTSNLVDGLYPGVSADPAAVAELTARRSRLLAERVDRPILDQSERVAQQLAEVSKALSRLPPPQLVYAGTVHQGSGNFRGTGPDGGRPRTIHILRRGDVTQPGREAPPGALSCVTALPARFDLPPDAPEGERRAALARWLTDPANPLPWRSIVNRVWQYHFGRGLVETPGDFGRMGAPPTHPELLDWLAVEFRDRGGSLKDLHRWIVTSRTWRQSSLVTNTPAHQRALAVDAENRWYWRMNRRQLEAEAVRDSLLAAAGRLDARLGGPSFRDFVIDKPEHSPHYEYHLHDPNDPRSHRRSVYRFLVRSQTQPFMAALDCADPSLFVDRRGETVSPLQALTLLNSGLSLVMSRHLADRLRRECGGESSELRDAATSVALRERQITRGFELALGRPPATEELAILVEYAGRHGLENACRVLLNLNEFLFVD
jgi:hypothetical protein